MMPNSRTNFLTGVVLTASMVASINSISSTSETYEGVGMQFPSGWRRVMMVVTVGKAALSGAVLVLAVLGALNVASTIAAHDWLLAFQRDHLDALVAGGGAAGAVVKLAWDRLA